MCRPSCKVSRRAWHGVLSPILTGAHRHRIPVANLRRPSRPSEDRQAAGPAGTHGRPGGVPSQRGGEFGAGPLPGLPAPRKVRCAHSPAFVPDPLHRLCGCFVVPRPENLFGLRVRRAAPRCPHPGIRLAGALPLWHARLTWKRPRPVAGQALLHDRHPTRPGAAHAIARTLLLLGPRAIVFPGDLRTAWDRAPSRPLRRAREGKCNLKGRRNGPAHCTERAGEAPWAGCS